MSILVALPSLEAIIIFLGVEECETVPNETANKWNLNLNSEIY